MKKLFCFVLIALAATIVAPPMLARNAQQVTWLMAEFLNNFNDRHPGKNIGLQVARHDLNGDGKMEFVLASMDTTAVEAYDLEASAPGAIQRVDVPQAMMEDIYWVPFLYAYQNINDLDYSTDITLSCRPLFAYPDKAKNRFTAFLDREDIADIASPQSYDRMIFKPHVNAVTNIARGKELVYKLNDASMMNTMFRGYSNGEAMPIIVPHQFLDTHNPLQYSRWKSPEPIQGLTPDARSFILAHYSGWRIDEARWLATCPISERTFYVVTFAPRDGKVLAAVVCITSEGVASAVDYQGYVEDGQASWFGDTDFFEHQPEFMAMMGTQFGFEMYVRYPSMEGTHYAIWREVLDQWVIVQDDYDYWYANEE